MNVIILTTGISGSSVMTGLLAKSGFWSGDETVYKDNITGKYETHENKNLVELNDQLIKLAGLEFDSKARYVSEFRDIFDRLKNEIDTEKFSKFAAECEAHSPWIWKDPRLVVTIGFWGNIIDLENTKIIIVYRNSYELWKSQASKRIIFSYRYLKKSEEESRRELQDYLTDKGLSYYPVEYDSFVQKPAASIRNLSQFLGTKLEMSAWNDIYKRPRKFDQLKKSIFAYLIYFKNYRSRMR